MQPEITQEIDFANKTSKDAKYCYHCGLPVPAMAKFFTKIDNIEREMCCAGCAAVAQTIVNSGLTSYYLHRDALPETPKEAVPEVLQELNLFDNQEFQKGFVQTTGESQREASLLLEGITCAACIWLIERHLNQVAGICSVQVNYATHRAQVCWDETLCKLSQILQAINQIGYHAYPYDAQRSEELAKKDRRSMLWRLFVAGFSMMQVGMYALPSYISKQGELAEQTSILFRIVSLLLTLPVVFYSAAPFFKKAWRDMRMQRFGMDVPVAIGIGGAFLASTIATVINGPEVYYDSVVMFVFFLLCGRYLELLARQKAVRGVEEIGKVIPAFSERKIANTNQFEKVLVAKLQIGDTVLVRPGNTIPVDGAVIEGDSEVNEAIMSGESLPVEKKIADSVIGGSINISSPLLIEVQQVGDTTQLASIRRLMERAMSERPRLTQLADRCAGYFISVLLLLAVATFIAWLYIDASRALWVCVSVLVVACPCALSLATPVALTVAIDKLSHLGVLVTRGHAVETLASVEAVVFDKTGTLTYGEMFVEKLIVLNEQFTLEQVKDLAASLEQSSEHLVAKGIRQAVDHENYLSITKLHAITGMGVEGIWQDEIYRIGKLEFVQNLVKDRYPNQLSQLEQLGGSIIALGGEHSGWIALFVLSDRVRANADCLFQFLLKKNKSIHIVSGDSQVAVNHIAMKLPPCEALGGMLPDQKLAWLSALQQKGKVVAMIGDGVNDTPVLAQAQVSIAMGSGTELARNEADIVLLSEKLIDLVNAFNLAGATLKIIRENITWALLYNCLAIPLAMFGWVTPWMAGIGMASSSLIVVLNALRLQKVKMLKMTQPL